MVKTAPKFQTLNGKETWISERLFVQEVLNHPGLPDASLATCRLPEGFTTQLHKLDGVDETYIIQQGIGLMRRGEDPPYAVGPGDCVFIARGTAQNIANTGTGDLVFTVLCLPRWTSESYSALEP